MPTCPREPGGSERDILKDTELCSSLLASISDGIVVLDDDARIMAWNRSMAELTGVPSSEVLGRDVLECFPSGVEEGLGAVLDRVLSGTEERVLVKGWKHYLKRGGVQVLDVLCYRLPDSGGSVRGAVIVVIDHTESVRLQEQVARGEQLAAAGQMLAGLAHGIGTPLNVITGNVEYLLSQMDEGAQGRAELEIILNEAARISRVMGQMLRMVRREEPTFRPTDVNAVVRSVLRVAGFQVASASIQMEGDLDEAVPMMEADAAQLEQMLVNLVLNAIQAMPSGGRLTVRSRLDGDRGRTAVRIEVSDTGCGIGSDDRRRVFDPFFTTKEPGRGTGLGLAVCKRIVEDHGGRISFDSELGKGASFTVRLPLNRSEESG